MAIFLTGLVVIFLLLDVDRSHAAPAQLLGKSVTASWDVTRVRRSTDDGETQTVVHSHLLNVYISAQGRIFNQMTQRRLQGGGKGGRRGRGGINVSEHVDESGPTSEATRQWRFEGKRLSRYKALDRGAQRISIGFDDAFTACSVQVTYGREGSQNILQTSRKSRQFELMSVDVQATGCSIKNGNVFAAQ